MTGRKEYRDSGSGEFVSREVGEANPGTTELESLPASAHTPAQHSQCQGTNATGEQCHRNGSRTCPSCAAFVCSQHYRSEHSEPHSIGAAPHTDA